MAKGSKQPFRLEMDPDEFLERAIRTKPSEVDALIARGKQKKPPGTKRKASGGTSQSEIRSRFTPQADAEAGYWSIAAWKAICANARANARFYPCM